MKSLPKDLVDVAASRTPAGILPEAARARFAVVLLHGDGRSTFVRASTKAAAGISAGAAVRMGTAAQALVVRIESVEKVGDPAVDAPGRSQSGERARSRSAAVHKSDAGRVRKSVGRSRVPSKKPRGAALAVGRRR